MALFKKERKYFALHTHGVETPSPEAAEVLTPSIPEGLYHKCRHCEKLVLREDLEKNLKICPKCGGYERMGAWERLDMILDPSTFREINDRIVGKIHWIFQITRRRSNRCKKALVSQKPWSPVTERSME